MDPFQPFPGGLDPEFDNLIDTIFGDDDDFMLPGSEALELPSNFDLPDSDEFKVFVNSELGVGGKINIEDFLGPVDVDAFFREQNEKNSIGNAAEAELPNNNEPKERLQAPPPTQDAPANETEAELLNKIEPEQPLQPAKQELPTPPFGLSQFDYAVPIEDAYRAIANANLEIFGVTTINLEDLNSTFGNFIEVIEGSGSCIENHSQGQTSPDSGISSGTDSPDGENEVTFLANVGDLPNFFRLPPSNDEFQFKVPKPPKPRKPRKNCNFFHRARLSSGSPPRHSEITGSLIDYTYPDSSARSRGFPEQKLKARIPVNVEKKNAVEPEVIYIDYPIELDRDDIRMITSPKIEELFEVATMPGEPVFDPTLKLDDKTLRVTRPLPKDSKLAKMNATRETTKTMERHRRFRLRRRILTNQLIYRAAYLERVNDWLKQQLLEIGN